jgi:hypothetical protein
MRSRDAIGALHNRGLGAVVFGRLAQARLSDRSNLADQRQPNRIFSDQNAHGRRPARPHQPLRLAEPYGTEGTMAGSSVCRSRAISSTVFGRRQIADDLMTPTGAGTDVGVAHRHNQETEAEWRGDDDGGGRLANDALDESGSGSPNPVDRCVVRGPTIPQEDEPSRTEFEGGRCKGYCKVR